MAAAAPAAPAPAAEETPAAKRQRLATTAVARTPPLVTHTWTIADLTVESFTGAAQSDKWEGPTFEACGLNWRLEVQPNCAGAKAPLQPTFGVFLRLVDRTASAVHLGEVTLRISGFADHTLTSCSFGNVHDSKGLCNPCWGFYYTHVVLAARAREALVGGQMVMSVTMRSRSYAELSVPAAPEPSLVSQMAAALPAPGAALADGVDVMFKAADGQRISAHSFVLALRSSTLRASLWGPLAASHRPQRAAQHRELDVPGGLDAAAFRRVVSFMYTDALPDFEGPPAMVTADLHALLHAADYLDVQRLRTGCAAELHKRLAADNAVDTLKLAHALSCGPLLDAALRFIAANAPVVMRTPSWVELDHEPGLKDAVLATLATGEPPAAIGAPRARAAQPPASA